MENIKPIPNFIGYVDGKEYTGTFHELDGVKMTGTENSVSSKVISEPILLQKNTHYYGPINKNFKILDLPRVSLSQGDTIIITIVGPKVPNDTINDINTYHEKYFIVRDNSVKLSNRTTYKCSSHFSESTSVYNNNYNFDEYFSLTQTDHSDTVNGFIISKKISPSSNIKCIFDGNSWRLDVDIKNSPTFAINNVEMNGKFFIKSATSTDDTFDGKVLYINENSTTSSSNNTSSTTSSSNNTSSTTSSSNNTSSTTSSSNGY